jgi:hypothetical protein
MRSCAVQKGFSLLGKEEENKRQFTVAPPTETGRDRGVAVERSSHRKILDCSSHSRIWTAPPPTAGSRTAQPPTSWRPRPSAGHGGGWDGWDGRRGVVALVVGEVVVLRWQGQGRGGGWGAWLRRRVTECVRRGGGWLFRASKVEGEKRKS